MNDARYMSPEQKIAAALDVLRPMLQHYDGPVYCATQGDAAKLVEILAGLRPRTYDAIGHAHTECRTCGSVVWDVYVIPPPEKGICNKCCPHKRPERDHRGQCGVCVPGSTSALSTKKEGT